MLAFEINRPFYRNSRQNTTSTCLSLLSFPNPTGGTNLNCFTDALQQLRDSLQTDYH